MTSTTFRLYSISLYTKLASGRKAKGCGMVSQNMGAQEMIYRK